MARDTCALAPGCDFPSLIGNDLYYGGLGGEFTISTSSDTSGTALLWAPEFEPETQFLNCKRKT